MAMTEDTVQELDDRRSMAKNTATGSTLGRTDDLEEDLVLPSIMNLQVSNRIQAEVDSRIKELQKITENLFIYLGFYVAFNTVQVISRWVVGRAEETST